MGTRNPGRRRRIREARLAAPRLANAERRPNTMQTTFELESRMSFQHDMHLERVSAGLPRDAGQCCGLPANAVWIGNIVPWDRIACLEPRIGSYWFGIGLT